MALSDIQIHPALNNPNVCFNIPELHGGTVMKQSPAVYMAESGKFCIVYKFQLSDGTYKAIRVWFHSKEEHPEIFDNVDIISSYLKKINSPYFLQYDYYPDGILINGEWRPMLIMDWCDGINLKKYVSKYHSQPSVILDLAKKFLDMVKSLHDNKISHGDLQHKNIMVKADGSIIVLDYDSICVPDNVGKKEIIKGIPGYQLFRVREKNEFLSPKVDYYSELVIYLSLLLIAHHPEIWTPDIDANDNILLFTDDDLANINYPSSILQKYIYDKEDNFFELVLELQNWFNFGKSIDDFKPLESIVDGRWLTGSTSNTTPNSNLTNQQEPLNKSIEDILNEMI